MMSTAVLNVELPYNNNSYQFSELDLNKEYSPRSEKDFGLMMSYDDRREHTPPPCRRRTCEDEEMMEISGNHARISSSEEESYNGLKKNSIGENFVSNPLQSARSRLAVNRFALDTIQLPTGSHGVVISPPDRNRISYDQTVSTKAKPNNNQKRPSSEENRLNPGGNFANANASFFDDDDDSWKICGVCNDKATGYHFNALTCEGCKGFFRRSVKNSKTFTCSYNNQCSITKNNRRQCQACRLRKCIEIGMKRECIMSQDQIQQKRDLVLTNRIKRAAQSWVPHGMTDQQKALIDTLLLAFKETNKAPDSNDVRGGDAVLRDKNSLVSPCPSPASTNSSNSNFIDLLKLISQDLMSRTPSNMASMTNVDHVLHFTDIMEFSIKEVIKFCKKIPTFTDLELSDQIALLKAGCTEIMFIKANYTYDIEKKALTLGPDIMYTRESFLQGGMSDEYTDAYLKFHEDLSSLQLDDTEMAFLSAISVFSADRSDVVCVEAVERQQHLMACALQAYSDNAHHRRNRFANIMSFLPRLRTLNSLCTRTFSKIQEVYGNNIKPLVMEVQPDEVTT